MRENRFELAETIGLGIGLFAAGLILGLAGAQAADQPLTNANNSYLKTAPLHSQSLNAARNQQKIPAGSPSLKQTDEHILKTGALVSAVENLIKAKDWFKSDANGEALADILDHVMDGDYRLRVYPEGVLLRLTKYGQKFSELANVYPLLSPLELGQNSMFRVIGTQSTGYYLIYVPNLPKNLTPIGSVEDLRKADAIIEAQHIRWALKSLQNLKETATLQSQLE